MKFLMDTVYTNRPSVCSTSYLMWELIERLIEWRSDTFFYVLFPPNKMEEPDWAFMSRFPDRVKLLPLVQCTSDRVSESLMLRNELRFYLNPWCEHTWDTDVVITSRVPMLKYMRYHASRQMGKALPSQRMYVGLEEMPFLPFRDTVPWSDHVYPDTLMSYGMADAVLINNQWTKKLLKPVLREVLSPAWQKRVLEHIHEVVPVKLERFKMKTEMYAGGQFEVAFVGRVTSTRNFGDVAELFRKSFAYPLGKNKQNMQYRISTNSETLGSGDYGEIDFIDMQMNDREKFYQFLHGSHVAVNLSTVEDFSLSTYETLRSGVPLIVHRQPWNEFLGESYPFRVDSLTEAYALLNAFASDYGKQYQRFTDWEGQYWSQYVTSSFNTTTSEQLIKEVQTFIDRRTKVLVDNNGGGSFRQQVQSIAETEPGVIDLTEYIKTNGRMLGEVAPHFSLPLGRVPSTLMLKLVAELEGYVDTQDVGVMHRE